MRQTKIEKCRRKVNDAFARTLDTAFQAKFERGCKTNFSIFSMCMFSVPADGGDFTPEQHAWVAAFSDGYSTAMSMVSED